MSNLATAISIPDEIVFAGKEESVLEQTADFVLYIDTAQDVLYPPEMRRMFYIKHKGTGVIHGRGPHLSSMIHALYEFQALLDHAYKHPRKPLPTQQEQQTLQLQALLAAGEYGSKQ